MRQTPVPAPVALYLTGPNWLDAIACSARQYGGSIPPGSTMQYKNANSFYASAQWRRIRERVFARDGYTCQACGGICSGVGRDDPDAPECDHIISLEKRPDLAQDMSNLQTLHKRCHSLKTLTEQGGVGRAQTHPDWLPKPVCKVYVVCGPAGGGKTTFARKKAGVDDEVIDLDDCFQMVCGKHGHEADRKHLAAALRVRNKMLANLAGKKRGSAYFIVSAPSEREREFWSEKTGGEIILIAPPLHEIDARDISPRRKRLARRWFEDAARNDWTPPKARKKREVGLDGYPVGS